MQIKNIRWNLWRNNKKNTVYTIIVQHNNRAAVKGKCETCESSDFWFEELSWLRT